jgi:hypothetical protein
VSFHRSLYREDALRAAAAAYDELLSVEIASREHEFLASFTAAPGDAPAGAAAGLAADPELVDAFCNHVLFETIRRERGAGT